MNLENINWNNVAGFLILSYILLLIFMFLYGLACSFHDEILKDDDENTNINVNVKIILKNGEKENDK